MSLNTGTSNGFESAGLPGPSYRVGELLMVVESRSIDCNLNKSVLNSCKTLMPSYGIYISDDLYTECFEDVSGRPDDPSSCGVCASQPRGSARCAWAERDDGPDLKVQGLDS